MVLFPQFTLFYFTIHVNSRNIVLAQTLSLLDNVKADLTSINVKGGDQDSKRVQILVESILHDKNPNSSTLIKGQTCDLDYNLPQSLKEKATEEEHKIVFLWVTPIELLNRRKKRGDDNITIEYSENEIKIQVDKLKDLIKAKFQLICIDNTNFSNPTTTDWNAIIEQREKLV